MACEDCSKCFVGAPGLLEVTDVAFGGVMVKKHVLLQAGATVAQHSHNYSHLTVLACGAMRVWAEGREPLDLVAPTELQIPAFAKHKFEALLPGTTFYCLHARTQVADNHDNALAGVEDDEGGWDFAQEQIGDIRGELNGLMPLHMEDIGREPDSWQELNWPLLESLCSRGVVQLTTVRSNGRLFGFSLGVIGPSFEAPGLKEGLISATFVDGPPALLTGLCREAIKNFRAQGCYKVAMRGCKFSKSAKMAPHYEALGALPIGEMYSLEFV